MLLRIGEPPITQITKPRRPRKMAREAEECSATSIPVDAPSIAVTGHTSTVPTLRQTKAGQIRAMLASTEGATTAELCAATGWLPHTCRAFLSGLRKRGDVLEKNKRDDGAMAYRLMPAEVQA